MKRLFGPAIILVVAAILFFVWYQEGQLSANPQDQTPIIFVVQPGESVSSIARHLENQRIIRNRLVFYLLVKFLGIEKQIQAGDFRLSKTMAATTIAKELTHGTLDVWVTIIEGMRLEEIAATVSEKLDIPESVFISFAKPKEGYLFPDTYLLPKKADSQQTVAILEKNFHSKITPALTKQIANQGLSLEEGIILASLLEREAQSLTDKKIVAGILFNRLNADIPLQVDATVQYALGYSYSDRSWWKKTLTLEDLQVDSPFNTYKYPGLPPSPIANPGLDSIQAVAAPTESEYLYYLTDKQGLMHYASTLEEHNANIENYLH